MRLHFPTLAVMAALLLLLGLTLGLMIGGRRRRPPPAPPGVLETLAELAVSAADLMDRRRAIAEALSGDYDEAEHRTSTEMVEIQETCLVRRAAEVLPQLHRTLSGLDPDPMGAARARARGLSLPEPLDPAKEAG